MNRDHDQPGFGNARPSGPGRADTRLARPNRRRQFVRRALVVAVIGVLVFIPLKRQVYHLLRGVATPDEDAPAFDGVSALAVFTAGGVVWLDQPDDIRFFQEVAFARKPWADPSGWRWNRLASGTIVAADGDGEAMYEVHYTRGDEMIPPGGPRGALGWGLVVAERLALSLDPPRSFVQIRGERRVFPIGKEWLVWLREIERQHKPMHRAPIRVRDGISADLIASAGREMGIPVRGVMWLSPVLDGRRKARVLCNRELGQKEIGRLEEQVDRLYSEHGKVEEPAG